MAFIKFLILIYLEIEIEWAQSLYGIRAWQDMGSVWKNCEKWDFASVQFDYLSYIAEVGGVVSKAEGCVKVSAQLSLCNLFRSMQPNDWETVIEG